MDRFLELLEALQNPGEEGPAPTIYDDLTQEYTITTEGAAARVAQLEAELAEKDQRLIAVMAHNYELLTATPANGPEATTEETNQEDAEDDTSLEDLITY